jgi:hypothetical protein
MDQKVGSNNVKIPKSVKAICLCFVIIGHRFLITVKFKSQWGKKIGYYLTKNGRSLKENFLADYSLFRLWLLTRQKESRERGEWLIVNDKVESYLLEKEIIDIETSGQATVDHLNSAYFEHFCDYGEGQDKFELVGPGWQVNKKWNAIRSR